MAKQNSPQRRYPLPLITLCATGTRRDILDALFTELDRDQYHRKADLADATGRSGESIRNNIGMLINFGIIETKSDPETTQIPHYRLADSEPVGVIEEYNDALEVTDTEGEDVHVVELLTDLCGSTARQDLLAFFLDEADLEQSYSRYSLHDTVGIGYEASKEHLSVLVEYGILGTVEGSRSTEYTLVESPLVAFCYDLNSALAGAYEAQP